MKGLKVFYAHDFTQDRSAAAMSPTEDYVEFYLKSDVDALLARRGNYEGLKMRLLNPNYREPRQIREVNETAINVIGTLEEKIKKLETELKKLRAPKKVKAKHSPLVERALCEMNDAIKDFGEYTYGDKGPYEVMDIESLALDFRAYEPDAAAAALVELSKVNDNAESLASCLTGHLQEWDELFEFLPEDFVW